MTAATTVAAGAAVDAPAPALYGRVSERAAFLDVSISPEELAEATACQWIAPQDIEAFPLPAPHRKLADNCSLFDNPASGE